MLRLHVEDGTVPGQTSGNDHVPTVSSEVTAFAIVLVMVVSPKSCAKGDNVPLLSEPIKYRFCEIESQQTMVSSASAWPTKEEFIGAMIATKKIEAKSKGRHDINITQLNENDMAHNIHADS